MNEVKKRFNISGLTTIWVWEKGHYPETPERIKHIEQRGYFYVLMTEKELATMLITTTKKIVEGVTMSLKLKHFDKAKIKFLRRTGWLKDSRDWTKLLQLIQYATNRYRLEVLGVGLKELIWCEVK